MKYAIIGLLVSQLAWAAPAKIPNDQLIVGKKSSAAAKSLELEVNAGVNNPKIEATNASPNLKLKSNPVTMGSGTAANQALIIDKGAGGANPQIKWDNAASKLQFTNDGTNFKSIGSGGGGGSGINLGQDNNMDFEVYSSTFANWTASNPSSITQATSGTDLIAGNYTAVFNPTAGGQTFTSDAINVATSTIARLGGSTGGASCFVKGAALDNKLQVWNGAVVLSEIVIPASDAPMQIGVPPFTVPTTGTIAIRVISQSDAVKMSVDNCSIGSAPTFQVAQAQYFGGITYPRANNCSWAIPVASGAYDNFPADADCVGAALRGKASAPATLVPGVTFASMQKGTYIFKVSSALNLNNAATGRLAYRISDGVNHSTITTQTSVGAVNVGSLAEFVVHIGTDSTNSTFQIQAFGSGQLPEINNDLLSASAGYPDLAIDVFYFPSQSQTASTFDTVAQSWSGYHNACDFQRTNSAFGVLPNQNPACSLTAFPGATNIGTVLSETTAGPVFYPGVVFSPNSAGKYRVCASATLLSSASGSTSTLALTTDGGTSYVDRAIVTGSGVGYSTQHRLCAQVSSPSTAPITVSIHGKDTSPNQINITGAVGGGYDVVWSIEKMDQQTPAPVISGAVISANSGVIKLESMRFGGTLATDNCTSTPCTIHNQTSGDFVTTMARSGLGAYIITVGAANFSSPNYMCMATIMQQGSGAGVAASLNYISATSIEMYAPADVYGTFTCLGQR